MELEDLHVAQAQFDSTTIRGVQLLQFSSCMLMVLISSRTCPCYMCAQYSVAQQ